MKVLVTYDNMADRLILQNHLKHMGHAALMAESGSQAIEQMLLEDPDLILMDVRMPVMDGYQTVQRIRELDHGWRPILFLSGDTDIKSFVHGIEMGGDDYLYKPIDREILAAKLKAMDSIVEMRRELIEISALLADETKKAHRMADEDGLTGIANRRHLDRILDNEFRRALRDRKPLSMIMIDIDWFKDFNDCFGHLEGDNVLRSCAARFSEHMLRPADLVARYGGEEFCVLLPNTDATGAEVIAEALRKSVESMQIATGGEREYEWLTISLGVATIVPELGACVADLICLADKALYQAKHDGRNCYRVATK